MTSATCSSVTPLASMTNCSASARHARSRASKRGEVGQRGSSATFASSSPAAAARPVRRACSAGYVSSVSHAQPAQLQEHGIGLVPRRDHDVGQRAERYRPRRREPVPVGVAGRQPVEPHRGHRPILARGRGPPTGSRGEVELEHADRVAAHDLAHRGVVDAGEQLARDLLGVGPGRVGVRVVGLEGDVVLADLGRATRCRARRGRSSRRPAGSSRCSAARARCPGRRPRRGAAPTRRRPVRARRGSSRSGPRCTRAAGSGTARACR